MIIQNLQQRCIDLANLGETYQHFWTKWVTSVDKSKGSGFAFIGDFFQNGATEIKTGHHLIIFAASTGLNGYSEKGRKAGYHLIYEYYEVFLLMPTGELERTGLVVTKEKSWAVALRDQVAMLLDKINQVYGEATPLQLAADHIFNRMLAVRLNQPQQWDQTDVNMIQIILDQLEKQRHTAISQSLNTSERVIT